MIYVRKGGVSRMDNGKKMEILLENLLERCTDGDLAQRATILETAALRYALRVVREHNRLPNIPR